MADIQKLNVNSTTYDISTTWSKVTGKPSTFPPESHTHSYLPLSGGTMSNQNVVVNLNADLLDGYSGSAYAKKTDLASYLPFTYKTVTSTTTSLNNCVDTSGIYVTNWAYAGSPYVNDQPWGNGGSSAATVVAFPGSYPFQFCRFYSTNDIYLRGYYSGTGWTSWEKIALSGEAQPASDVYSWAKASSKPTYTYSEVGAAPASHGTHLSGNAGFTSNSTAGVNCNDATSNGHWYWSSNGPSTAIGAAYGDGALYTQAYSSSWVAQIAQDYGNGKIFTRSKNNGTWNDWKALSYDGHTHSQYITGITKSMVTTALGYTPPTSDTNTWRPVTNTYTGSDQSTCVSQYGTNALYNALLNGYASSAGTASNANAIASTGFGNGNFTYLQTSSEFFGNSGWAHYLISNHGDGSSYYNFTIGLPFWGVPIYKRLEGGTEDGWYTFITSENIGSQSVNYANSAGSAPASDVYSWAKAASKPSYTYSEVGAASSGHTHTSFANSITVTGSVSASSGFYQSSDERLKIFYDPIKVDLEKLKKLRKNYFKFNDKDKLEIGVSAQEIQSLYPEIVSTNDEGYLSVAYDKLSVIALAALDEQQKEIDDLKDQLSTIKNILKEKGIL